MPAADLGIESAFWRWSAERDHSGQQDWPPNQPEPAGDSRSAGRGQFYEPSTALGRDADDKHRDVLRKKQS